MKKILNNYISTFKGLSLEVWWLSLITLVNRAGTMVIPFLSLYLNKNLGFSLANVGWILSFWGVRICFRHMAWWKINGQNRLL
jgi:predicted MFS family arabinose efflux permease